jgi:hypothetical protein
MKVKFRAKVFLVVTPSSVARDTNFSENFADYVFRLSQKNSSYKCLHIIKKYRSYYG